MANAANSPIFSRQHRVVMALSSMRLIWLRHCFWLTLRCSWHCCIDNRRILDCCLARWQLVARCVDSGRPQQSQPKMCPPNALQLGLDDRSVPHLCCHWPVYVQLQSPVKISIREQKFCSAKQKMPLHTIYICTHSVQNSQSMFEFGIFSECGRQFWFIFQIFTFHRLLDLLTNLGYFTLLRTIINSVYVPILHRMYG